MIWRRLFLGVLLFSCVDGFIANYYYPAPLPLLFRDILVLGLYFIFFLQESLPLWIGKLCKALGPGVWAAALGFLFVGTLQIFNPQLPSLLVGLIGFKVVFFYWPLAVLAYAYTVDMEAARRLAKGIVLLSIPINLFGLYQFWQGPYFLVDTFGPGFERATVIAHIEGIHNPEDSFLRVIGTFASSGQYAYFLIFNAMLNFALLMTTVRWRGRFVYMVSSILNFVVLLATGSRGALLMLAATSLCLWILSLRVRRVFGLGALTALAIYLGFHWLGAPVVARFETLRDIDMIYERTIETTPVMFSDLLKRSPLGEGLGIGSPASRHLLGEESPEYQMVENHLSKLQLEMGLPGVITFYLFALLLLLRQIQWRWRLGMPATDLLSPLIAFCTVFLASQFLIGGFDSPPSALFFWALIGLIAKAAGGFAQERAAP